MAEVVSSSRGNRLIDKINQRRQSGDVWFSLEYFPPRTPRSNEVLTFIHRFERMIRGKPLFYDITWHPAGDPGNVDKPNSSICISRTMVNYHETILHMACNGQTDETAKQHLQNAKGLGIRNILALQGDPPLGEYWKYKEGCLNYATELVKLIRKEFGDYFVICVAGYPNGHPLCTSYKEDLQHLKEKVDAGADFIISQLFFEAGTYLKFFKDCRDIGIKCPIVPGFLPIQTYTSLRHILKLTKLNVPKNISDVIDPIKDNADAILNFGIDFGVELCKAVLKGLKEMDSEDVTGLHFYTLNREEGTIEILKRLEMWNGKVRRPLTWKLTANNASNLTEERLLEMWGNELRREEDVWDVFFRYYTGITGEAGLQVTEIPWIDHEMSAETAVIADRLGEISKQGVLTINYQPAIHVTPSTDRNGYIFQKTCLEFFTTPENVEALKEILTDNPLVNYHIFNRCGDADYTNCDKLKSIDITGGDLLDREFPGAGILQPTVVDPTELKLWEDKAFALWMETWGRLYPADSPSREVIQSIQDRYRLVHLIDNEFSKPSCLLEIVGKMLSRANVNL